MIGLLMGSTAVDARGEGEGEGQPELDQAIEAKLSAETVNDLGKVVKLCETALEKGLDDENREFAERLLSSTLIQRARALAQTIRPPWPNERRALARILQLRGIAISDLTRALELDPNQAEAHVLLGQLHSQPGGDREKAMESLNRAIELAAEDPRLRARALAARAPLQDDPEDVLADFDAAIELAPRNAAFVRDRGLYRIQHGDVEEGLTDLDRSLELNPEHVDTLEARALALGMQENVEQALASLDRAIELDPQRASAYYHRGRLHLASENIEAAIEDLSRALELKPSLADARLARAEAYRRNGDLEEAIADLDDLQKVAPNLDLIRRLRLQLLVQVGRTQQAIEELQKTIEARDEPSADLQVELGTLFVLAEQDEKAIEAYSAAIDIDPETPNAYLRRADTRVRLGQHREAIKDYEEALQRQPEDSSVLNNLAWLLATSPRDDLRDGKRSIELAQKACEVTDYQQAHILSTLAAGYAELGDFETAIEWSQKAVELGGPDLKEALEKELARYRSGKPWREEKPGAPVPADQDAVDNDSSTPAEDDGNGDEQAGSTRVLKACSPA